ncbi:ATP-binding protein [Nocardia jiangsuensis]|uniref:ATP-binding protein n=1 Tax=Nocardia jiangsuensis TaxID=1691563 RepID=A0ABV8DQM6_9NOCA
MTAGAVAAAASVRVPAGRWVRGLLSIAAGPAAEPAADRILRRLGLSVGIAGVIVGLVELPEIAEQSRGADPGRVLLTVVLAFGLFPVLAVVSVAMNRRAIQRTAAAAAVSFLLAALMVPSTYPVLPAGTEQIWQYKVLVLGVLVAALSWRLSLAVGYLVLSCVLISAANAAVLPEVTPVAFVNAVARSGGLAALFAWCVIYARAAAARVDRESALESRRAAAVAGAAARERERARFAALIHDAVLSTLLDASRGGCTEPSVLHEQAQRTIAQLDAVRGGGIAPDRLDAQSAIGFLRSAVHEVNPEIEFRAQRPGVGGDLDMPLEAAVTLAAALTEAARNSLRHATVPGRAVHRTVTVTIGAGGIRVVLRDDGAGFDPCAVPPDRLGVAVSILGRMSRLPGGAGFVESRRGEGTTVTLVWGNGG